MAKPTGMPRGKLKNLVINELSGVDRPCQQPATVAVMKRAPDAAAPSDPIVEKSGTCPDCGAVYKGAPAKYCATCGTKLKKSAVLTSEDNGHAHSLDIDSPASSWCDSYSTSSQTAKGADSPHSHAWTFDATTGAITIAADSDHSHTVTATVPADVRAAAVLNEAAETARRAKDNASAAAEAVSSGAVTITVTAAGDSADKSAPTAPKSPPSDATATVKQQEQGMPTEAETIVTLTKQVADLEKQRTRFEKMSLLTDAQRAHFNKLSGIDADQFLALSPPMRDVELANIAKADEIVYTSPIDGAVYRKSDSVQVIKLAQRSDAATISMQKAEANERIAKFAALGDKTLTYFAKGVKNDLRGRIMKALDAEFTVPAEHEEAVTALKSANWALEQNTIAKGVNPHADATVVAPDAKLRAAVQKYQADRKLASYEAALVDATGSDPEIRKLWESSAA